MTERTTMSNVYTDCMDFFARYEKRHDDAKAVTDGWHKVFVGVCKHLGINRRSANVLFENMCLGNWKHLHQTDGESEFTSDIWFDKFLWDVFYCSDRWSVDRLMRCHWCFRQWLSSCVGTMEGYNLIGLASEK